MTPKQLQKVRRLTKRLKWTRVKSSIYKSCPHEYASVSNDRRTFGALAKMVRKHGVNLPWREYRYRYLIVDRYAIWWLGAVLNRSYKSALSNNGYPNRKDRAKIKKRFWGGD